MQVLVLDIMSMESTEASEVPEVVPRIETKVVWKEGLALTNGTAVMCALGALAVERAEMLSAIADTAGCLSLEALDGTLEAFDERIQAALAPLLS